MVPGCVIRGSAEDEVVTVPHLHPPPLPQRTPEMPPFPAYIVHETSQPTIITSLFELDSKQQELLKMSFCILAPSPPSSASPSASFPKMIRLSMEKHSFSSR